MKKNEVIKKLVCAVALSGALIGTNTVLTCQTVADEVMDELLEDEPAADMSTVELQTQVSAGEMAADSLADIISDDDRKDVLLEDTDELEVLPVQQEIAADIASKTEEPAEMETEVASETEPATEAAIEMETETEQETEISAEQDNQGSCGENAFWEFLEDGTLKITGTGCMINWDKAEDVPWHLKRAEIKTVIIEGGIENVGSYAFCDCENLERTDIPVGITEIGAYSFGNCVSMSEISLG